MNKKVRSRLVTEFGNICTLILIHPLLFINLFLFYFTKCINPPDEEYIQLKAKYKKMEEDLEKVGSIARIAATLQEEYKVGVSSGRSLVGGYGKDSGYFAGGI